MGPRLKLPPYVQAFVDRQGRARFYFRRRGYQSVPLPGLPWSPTFMAAYEAAKGEPSRIEVGLSRTTVGTVNAAVISYFNSAAFQGLALETQRSRRGILERFRVEHGDKRIALLQRAHIDRMVAAKAATPSAARNFLKALKAMMAHCVAIICATMIRPKGSEAQKSKQTVMLLGARSTSSPLKRGIQLARALG